PARGRRGTAAEGTGCALRRARPRCRHRESRSSRRGRSRSPWDDAAHDGVRERRQDALGGGRAFVPHANGILSGAMARHTLYEAPRVAAAPGETVVTSACGHNCGGACLVGAHAPAAPTLSTLTT